MVVVLFPVSDEEPRLQPGALEQLARLGVTSVALLRDTSIAGLVLEGWAFDPNDAPRAASAVGGAAAAAHAKRGSAAACRPPASGHLASGR